MKSRSCSYLSLMSPELSKWAECMRPYWDDNLTGSPIPPHRKIWEWAYIAASLEAATVLQPGRRGLGFGVGREPLVPLFASLGCDIVATDQAASSAELSGWSSSNQFAGDMDSLNEKHLCNDAEFRERATFQTVDMTSIPNELTGFDFTWSSCAFEHLGSIEAGLDFIIRQMRCLKPGGTAVHTTEFNISSDTDTVTEGPTVLFRKTDFEALAGRLARRGHQVTLDFTLGTTDYDEHVDRPPWSGSHLRLYHDGYVITSFGLTIRKNRGPDIRSALFAASRAKQTLHGVIGMRYLTEHLARSPAKH